MNMTTKTVLKWTVFLSLLLLVSIVAAEMTVITKDGRQYTVPVNSCDVKQILYSDGSAQAPASRYWKLINVTVDKHRIHSQMVSDPFALKYSFSDANNTSKLSCTDNSCESSNTFRNHTHLKASYKWSKPPATIAPDSAIPITMKVEVLESRVGPGGYSASIDARFVPGRPGTHGWATDDKDTPEKKSGWNGIFVHNTQPAGTASEHSNKRLKTVHGKTGDKTILEVFVNGGVGIGVIVFQYHYEWVE